MNGPEVILYPCTVCGQEFENRNSMANHVRWTHKEKKFSDEGYANLKRTGFKQVNERKLRLRGFASSTGQIIWDDVYEDSGTTSRIVYRTENQVAPGFLPNYYVSMALGYDPANTTLSGRPVVVSCDILSRNLINLGN